jgi:hypothetical protein
MCKTGKEQIARHVLAYLSTYQDAQDTLEGVVEWWLLEQKISHHVAEVKEALEELVTQELIVARQGKDARIHYQINRRKADAIASLLKQNPD